jgi:hypothetical protein
LHQGLNRRPFIVIGHGEALADLFHHALLELRGVKVAAGSAGSARPAIATEISGTTRTTRSARSARSAWTTITRGRPAGAATVVILGLQISAAQTQRGYQS